MSRQNACFCAASVVVCWQTRPRWKSIHGLGGQDGGRCADQIEIDPSRRVFVSVPTSTATSKSVCPRAGTNLAAPALIRFYALQSSTLRKTPFSEDTAPLGQCCPNAISSSPTPTSGSAPTASVYKKHITPLWRAPTLCAVLPHHQPYTIPSKPNGSLIGDDRKSPPNNSTMCNKRHKTRELTRRRI